MRACGQRRHLGRSGAAAGQSTLPQVLANLEPSPLPAIRSSPATVPREKPREKKETAAELTGGGHTT